MRFNPPPNWPPVPPGWVPDAGWSPDPAWPPPPDGWQLWVDDGAPPLEYPVYGEPWPAPPAKSRKALWISLAAVAVVIAIAVGGGFLVSYNARIADLHSRKRAITTLTSEMLLDRSAFPDSSEGKAKWISGVNNSTSREPEVPGITFDPPECGSIFGTKGATQTGAATLTRRQSAGVGSLRVGLMITPERRDLKGYLQKCQSYTQSIELAGHALTTELQLKPLDIAGVPPWAVGAVMSSSPKHRMLAPVSMTSATVAGYYRGVLVTVSNSLIQRGTGKDDVDSATAEELAKLFNEQIQKLEAAP
ncbi:hypothetical protein KIH27_06885 [Mycobacterium sp. M1]|uniref:Uncharacterized protein n=1 Tax=Mycolicibacter acidiphilus TaxID=2835306 RepID=A0ABS5RK49_9MYCO|nr:hypothetical protein [Mycolicibacter acidiphilus]MBS9533314.1 hypothetical protein [Mycolicibacter acidiphilus]